MSRIEEIDAQIKVLQNEVAELQGRNLYNRIENIDKLNAIECETLDGDSVFEEIQEIVHCSSVRLSNNIQTAIEFNEMTSDEFEKCVEAANKIIDILYALRSN